MSDIVVAPFSNSGIRDWPPGHYAAMIALLLSRWTGRGRVRVIGTGNQRLGVCEIVRKLPVDRVSNECGRMSWNEVTDALVNAACVIGNNSGIAHLAGSFRAPTVCVFGGSHQRLEWRPLGDTVVIVSRAIGCSPCHLDHNGTSPYNKACLRQIEPDVVADAAIQIMARVADMRQRPGADDARGGARR